MTVCANPTCDNEFEQPRKGRRKFCSERCRKSQYSAPCIDCGAPMAGGDRVERCFRCGGIYSGRLQQEAFAEHRARIEELWAQGLTIREMAEAMGWKNEKVAQVQISILRSKGVDLPHRYSPERVAKTASAIRAAVARREQRKKSAAVPGTQRD